MKSTPLADDETVTKAEADIIAKCSPQFLFDEYTFLSRGLADEIISRCLECKAIPLIEYFKPYDRWLFHSLGENGLIYKKECASLFPREPVRRDESDYEREISELLSDCGIPHRRQVECAAGYADIVSETTVVEVKLQPSHDVCLKAIGQAVAYRATLGVPHAAIITLYHIPAWMGRACRQVGIRCFTRKSLKEMAEWLMEAPK